MRTTSENVVSEAAGNSCGGWALGGVVTSGVLALVCAFAGMIAAGVDIEIGPSTAGEGGGAACACTLVKTLSRFVGDGG